MIKPGYIVKKLVAFCDSVDVLFTFLGRYSPEDGVAHADKAVSLVLIFFGKGQASFPQKHAHCGSLRFVPRRVGSK